MFPPSMAINKVNFRLDCHCLVESYVDNSKLNFRNHSFSKKKYIFQVVKIQKEIIGNGFIITRILHQIIMYSNKGKFEAG